MPLRHLWPISAFFLGLPFYHLPFPFLFINFISATSPSLLPQEHVTFIWRLCTFSFLCLASLHGWLLCHFGVPKEVFMKNTTSPTIPSATLSLIFSICLTTTYSHALASVLCIFPPTVETTWESGLSPGSSSQCLEHGARRRFSMNSLINE